MATLTAQESTTQKHWQYNEQQLTSCNFYNNMPAEKVWKDIHINPKTFKKDFQPAAFIASKGFQPYLHLRKIQKIEGMIFAILPGCEIKQ